MPEGKGKPPKRPRRIEASDAPRQQGDNGNAETSQGGVNLTSIEETSALVAGLRIRRVEINEHGVFTLVLDPKNPLIEDATLITPIPRLSFSEHGIKPTVFLLIGAQMKQGVVH